MFRKYLKDLERKMEKEIEERKRKPLPSKPKKLKPAVNETTRIGFGPFDKSPEKGETPPIRVRYRRTRKR